MEKLQSYEQYSQVLAAFKEGRARCATNKMMMRGELTALIEAGKLYYEQMGDTLWFFSDEDYFYYAHLYAPADSPIRMHRQDKDVVVELMGNESRYNEQMDRELAAVGFEKGGKYLEYGAMLDEIIDDVRRQNKAMRIFWEKRGFTYRAATKADYPELRALQLRRLGTASFNVTTMTEAEQNDMEANSRCTLICDKEGTIAAASFYSASNRIAYTVASVAEHQGSGLGACAFFDLLERIYEAGFQKTLGWARVDNLEGTNLQLRAYQRETGKYFWQFVFRV